MKRALLMIAAVYALTACSEASFTQPGKKIPAKKPATKVERFPLATKATRIVDMVWIIDNSGSMTDEIELVRQNFGSFVSTVSEFSDLNLGLVTAETAQDSRRGIDLHFLAPNIRSQQFTYSVGSTNALSLLASGICDPSLTTEAATGTLSDSVVCGSNISGYMEGRQYVSEIRGQLKPFFREDSKKVFVVVTDDNASGIDNNNFLTIVNSQLPAQEVYVFGFVGLTNTRGAANPATGLRECSVAEVGSAYQDLAAKTKGQAFDICKADWSSHFDELTKNVENIVNTEFTLNTSKQFNLVEILVDGQLLPEGTFNVENNRIVILDRTYLQGGETLEVKYTVQKD